jgi:hypothetical protein
MEYGSSAYVLMIHHAGVQAYCSSSRCACQIGCHKGRPIAGGLHITGIVVVALAGDRIRELTRFESALALYFPLPRTLD